MRFRRLSAGPLGGDYRPTCRDQNDSSATLLVIVRDDFPPAVRRVLALRVGYCCSRPDCAAATTGPQMDDSKAVNVGVAAHITAASAGGPRFDASLNRRARVAAANGIWLCQNCAKLVDNDSSEFNVEVLRKWKRETELAAKRGVGRSRGPQSEVAANVAVRQPGLRVSYSLQRGASYWRNVSHNEIRILLSLTNVGTTAALAPCVRLEPSAGFSVSPFGTSSRQSGSPLLVTAEATQPPSWNIIGRTDFAIHPRLPVQFAEIAHMVKGNVVVPSCDIAFIAAASNMDSVEGEVHISSAEIAEVLGRPIEPRER